MKTLFSLVGINFLLAGFSFLTTIVIANALGKEIFGDLSYAIAIGGYCLSIAYCGLERTLIRDLVHAPVDFEKNITASIALRAGMLIIAALAMFFGNSLVQQESRLAWYGILIVAAEGAKSLHLAAVFDAQNKMERHAIYLLVERCAYFACIWGVFVFFKERLTLQLIAYFMGFSTLIGLALQYRWLQARMRIRIDRMIILMAISMLKRNLWVWSAVLATLSFGVLSKIVLKNISGSSELGGYSIAWQIVVLGTILITQVGRIGNPKLAKIVKSNCSKKEIARFVFRYTALSSMAGAVIGIPAMIFPELILQIFSEEYISAAKPMRIFGAYLIIIGAGQVSIQYLISTHLERSYSIVVFLSSGISVFLYSICIPRWSSSGAAAAVLISHGLAISTYTAIMLRSLFGRAELKGSAI